MVKNFTVNVDGVTYWISPSPAIVAFIFCVDKNDVFILCNKRGEGAAPPKYLWNAPCGYLEFGETAEQCCKREVFEETGVKINDKFIQIGTKTGDPNENYNVTIRHYAIVPSDYLNHKLTNKNSEYKETEEIKWININDLDNYKWAFNHDVIIKDTYEKYVYPKLIKLK